MKRDKAKGERLVFRRFAAVSGLNIDLKSIRSGKPPRSDISCRVGKTPYYFELTRMAHRGSANAMGHHLAELAREGTAQPLAADCYDDCAALREAIERKARGIYEADGRPIGLLVIIDGVFHPPGMPPQWARTILEQKGPNNRWIRIWLYDSVYDRVVASWRCSNEEAQPAPAGGRGWRRA